MGGGRERGADVAGEGVDAAAGEGRDFVGGLVDMIAGRSVRQGGGGVGGGMLLHFASYVHVTVYWQG